MFVLQDETQEMKECFTNFVEENSLSAQCIPVAIFAHEALGRLWLTGSWFACYKLQPARYVVSLAKSSKLEVYLEKAKKYDHRPFPPTQIPPFVFEGFHS